MLIAKTRKLKSVRPKVDLDLIAFEIDKLEWDQVLILSPPPLWSLSQYYNAVRKLCQRPWYLERGKNIGLTITTLEEDVVIHKWRRDVRET